ncbi:MAG: hypothetical protein A2Z34_01140 [Planctomycetes bacterium RBG_16_59_8]|nr:MAG: hypothetical protein A2Z34_01140 [Planctomycetes bacterium RBG_16_59_8]
MSLSALRKTLLLLWLIFLAASLYSFFFQPEILSAPLDHFFRQSFPLACVLYLLLGSLRGFTFIPSTTLVMFGALSFPAVSLFILSLAGILISSTTIYYFSSFLGIEELLKKRNEKAVMKLTEILQKNELPIIILWSFTPFLPTDAICYLCGTLRVDFGKFLIGIAIGESALCALYIFGGRTIISLFQSG